jgi:hypothetical protein
MVQTQQSNNVGRVCLAVDAPGSDRSCTIGSATKGSGPSEACVAKSNAQRRIINGHVIAASDACAYTKRASVSTTQLLCLLLQTLAAMSGAVAPPRKKAAVDRLTRDDERPFASHIAKYEADEQRKKNNPTLQAELHGQGTSTSDKAKKPKRKKSGVSMQIVATYLC